MALDKDFRMNIRQGGSNTNGIGYKTSSSGTDYSQQDAAQVTVTDGVSNGTTTLSSATGGFTTYNIVGNGLYNSGTGEIYEVKSVTDDNNLVVDRTVASASGLTFNIGGAGAVIADFMYDNASAGHMVAIMDGNYTMTETVTCAIPGSSVDKVWTYGYETDPDYSSDRATGLNRPNIAMGSYNFQTSSHHITENLRGTGNGSYCINSNFSYTIIYNCLFEKTGAGTMTAAFRVSTSGIVSSCEVTKSAGTLTYGIMVTASNSKAVGNYIKAAGVGIYGYIILFNILDGCTTYGIDDFDYSHIAHNTAYNCLIGINVASPNPGWVYMNDLNSCTARGIGGALSRDNYLQDNNYYDNVMDVYRATKGAGATAVDPVYEDAANGNFKNVLPIKSSIMLGAMLNMKAGAVQNSAPGAGGGVRWSGHV